MALTVDGAPALEAGGLVGLVVAVLVGAVVDPVGLDIDVEDAGREEAGAVAGLPKTDLGGLETAVLPVLATAEVLAGGTVEVAGRLARPVVLGLAPLTGTAGAFLGALVDNGPLLPLVAGAGAEATRAFPTGFLSATLVWVRAGNAAVPVGLLGTAPDVDVTPAVTVVVFFSRSAATVLDAWVPLTPRAVPGRL